MSDLWVLVANSAEARIYRGKHPRAPLTLLETLQHDASRAPARELISDAPGRVHDRFGLGRHSVESGQSAKTEEAERFAREIADRLSRARQAGAFGRLVVVAAPAFLGQLRRVLDKSVAAAVVAEVNKDLVRAGAEAIQDQIP
jgi:protein required for attachment to host cells